MEPETKIRMSDSGVPVFEHGSNLMYRKKATGCRRLGQPVVVSFGDHAVSSLTNSSGKTSFGQTMKNLFAFNIKVSLPFPVSGQFLLF